MYLAGAFPVREEELGLLLAPLLDSIPLECGDALIQLRTFLRLPPVPFTQAPTLHQCLRHHMNQRNQSGQILTQREDEWLMVEIQALLERPPASGFTSLPQRDFLALRRPR